MLADAGLEKSEVDEIVLVGGSTRIPKARDGGLALPLPLARTLALTVALTRARALALTKVRALLEKFFAKPINTKLNPDEAVAYGGANPNPALGPHPHPHPQPSP